jgi:hypothetical protein
MRLLAVGHGVPLFVATGIAPDIVEFGQEINENIRYDKAY